MSEDEKVRQRANDLLHDLKLFVVDFLLRCGMLNEEARIAQERKQNDSDEVDFNE